MSKDKPGTDPKKIKVTIENDFFVNPEGVSNLIVETGEAGYKEYMKALKEELEKWEINEDGEFIRKKDV